MQYSCRCVPRTALSRVLLDADIFQDKQAVMNVVRRICATINCVNTPYVSERLFSHLPVLNVFCDKVTYRMNVYVQRYIFLIHISALQPLIVSTIHLSTAPTWIPYLGFATMSIMPRPCVHITANCVMLVRLQSILISVQHMNYIYVN